MELDYDEIVAQDLNPQAKTEKNEYDDLVQEDIDQSATNISTNFLAAEAIEPDRAAQVLKLAKDLDLPSDIVERNFDSLSKEQYKVKAEPAKMLQKNPLLARWLEEPDNVKVAKDDLDNLEKIDNLSKDVGFASEMFNAIKYGVSNIAANLAKSPSLAYTPNYGPSFLYEGASGEAYRQDEIKAAGGMAPPKTLYDNQVTRFFDDKAKEFKPEGMEKSFTEELSKGNTQAAIKALSLQIASNIPQIGMVAIAGPAALSILGVTAGTEKLVSNLEKGIDPELAKSNALVTGGIEAGVESLFAVGSPGFKESIKQAASVLGNAGAKEMISNAIKSIGKNAFGEGIEEVAATVSTSILDWGTGVDDKALDGLVNKSLDSFFVGAGAGGVVGGSSFAIERAQQKFQESTPCGR